MTTLATPKLPARPALMLGAFFGVLVAQFIFTLVIDEPFPSVIFPAFKNAPRTRALTTTHTTLIAHMSVEGGEHDWRAVTATEIFGELPAATMARHLKRICPPDEDIARHQTSRLTHGHKPHYRLRVWLQDDLASGYYRHESRDVKTWVGARLTTYGARALRLQWRETHIDLLSGEQEERDVVHECVWQAHL